MTVSVSDALTLLDWKRRIFDLYERVRAEPDARRAWHIWKDERDELFRNHPQSPVPEERRSMWKGAYFDYEPSLRGTAAVVDQQRENYDIATSGDETMRFTRIGRAEFAIDGSTMSLDVYWLDAYGGGLFVPFRDATAGDSTYGAGRYLLDIVKGADLGEEDGRLAFDFNFAYNPSCAYDPRWVCPLAPPANRLEIAIEAGEKTPAP